MVLDEIYVPTERYVYYNDEGEILSISNTNETDGNYIVVELDKVINFLTGKESSSMYLVVYDTLIKQHVLKLKYQADENAFRVNDDIYEVKKISKQNPDLTIIQDVKNKKWIFEVNDGLKAYLKSQKVNYNRALYFSITRKNDPHDLYHLITLDFKKLIEQNSVEIPFKYQTEESIDNLSVYTTKRFENYLYEVKNVE
jgi:hypothetical protein